MRLASSKSTLDFMAPEENITPFFGRGILESGSNHGIQQCFGEIVTNTSHFTRRRHIYAQYRVCLVQTGERRIEMPSHRSSRYRMPIYQGREYGASSMMRVAVSIKLRFSTLDTNGKLREARRLHSITFTSLLRARNWILNGPEILSSFAI